MGGLYNVYTVKGERIFHYRFTCGKCNKTTPWKSCRIEGEHSIQTKSSLSKVQQQLEEDLAKKLNGRIDTLKREVENGYLFSQPSMSLHEDRPYGNCPYCGQPPKHKGTVSKASIVSGIIGLFVGMITSAVLAWFYIFESFSPMITLTLATTIAGVIIGVIIGKHNMRKGTTHKNVEYWWANELPFYKMGASLATNDNVTLEEPKHKVNTVLTEDDLFIQAQKMTFSKYAPWGETPDKAKDAIKDINDIGLLEKLFSNAISSPIRDAAKYKRDTLLYEKRENEVRNLHNQAELIRIAEDINEDHDIRKFVISELITDRTALSRFVKSHYGRFVESVFMNKNIDRQILLDIVLFSNYTDVTKGAYRKLKDLNRLEIATIILNSCSDIRDNLLNKTNDQSLLKEIFHTQGKADLKLRSDIYAKLEDHKIEIVRKIKAILDKRIDDHCTFEKCNGRAFLIAELIELLEKDDFAAKGFWESLKHENNKSDTYHVGGNSEYGEHDLSFTNYNLVPFPPYPFDE